MSRSPNLLEDSGDEGQAVSQLDYAPNITPSLKAKRPAKALKIQSISNDRIRKASNLRVATERHQTLDTKFYKLVGARNKMTRMQDAAERDAEPERIALMKRGALHEAQRRLQRNPFRLDQPDLLATLKRAHGAVEKRDTIVPLAQKHVPRIHAQLLQVAGSKIQSMKNLTAARQAAQFQPDNPSHDPLEITGQRIRPQHPPKAISGYLRAKTPRLSAK